MSLLLLLVVSWCGAASLQQLDHSAEPLEVDNPLEPFPDSRSQFDPFESTPLSEGYFYTNEDYDQGNQNYGSFYKTDEPNQESAGDDGNRNRRWIPNIIDTDKTLYIKVDGDKESPLLLDDDSTDVAESKSKVKRNFSPWGGKRDELASGSDGSGYVWSWKRTPRSKESNMPKRVRFSPWGGKRSSNVVFKPSKTSKIIYSLTPDLWVDQQRNPETRTLKMNKISSPFRNLKKKYQLLKFKRNAFEFLKKNRFPLYNFSAQSLNSVDAFNKDGKRKVKFSAWGGKRSPPVIGPVWAPPTQITKEKMNTILLNDESNKRHLLKL